MEDLVVIVRESVKKIAIELTQLNKNLYFIHTYLQNEIMEILELIVNHLLLCRPKLWINLSK